MPEGGRSGSVSSGLPAPSGAGDVPVLVRVLTRLTGGLHRGRLLVVWPDGRETLVRGSQPGPTATLVVREGAAVTRVLLGGAVGFAEGYMERSWDTADLVALLDLLLGTIAARDAGRGHLVPLQPVRRLLHRCRENTLRGSKRNVAYHYDLGNDFYRLWLDPTMSYSCALFSACPAGEAATGGLEEAQRAKWDRLLGLLDPRPGDRLLEIGSGWGGFALHAARVYGCRVVGVTLSQEQLAYAQARAQEAGLGERVAFRLQDYRDVTGTFDHVASIEMFEAVGERYWPAFFATVRDRLAPGGKAAVQVITIAEERFADYRRRPDFAQRYIFPGGMLPSPSRFAAGAVAAGLAVEEQAFFAADYEATVSTWLERFDARALEVRALGFDERFRRMWRYYLAYCVAGFRNRTIDVMQVRLRRGPG
jgi:cyclopropane-fatty-acyl-phospholipid synthase